jgi:hypothetical protein
MSDQFIHRFDPKDKEHVLWLKDVCAGMAKATGGDRVDIIALANSNPFNCALSSPLDFAQAHFQLAMKYTSAVLSEEAWVPGQKNVV